PSLLETTRATYPHEARWRAVRALGIIGSRARGAVPMLLALLEDRNLDLCAIEALGEIGPTAGDAVPGLLCKFGRNEDTSVLWRISEPLARIGSASLPGLESLLAERDEKLLIRVLETIGAMGAAARQSLPAVEAFLEDEDPRVSAAAME